MGKQENQKKPESSEVMTSDNYRTLSPRIKQRPEANRSYYQLGNGIHSKANDGRCCSWLLLRKKFPTIRRHSLVREEETFSRASGCMLAQALFVPLDIASGKRIMRSLA